MMEFLRRRPLLEGMFGQRRYPESPERCRCGSCGYVLEMKGEHAGKHCRGLDTKCPQCGAVGNWWRA